MRQERLSDDVMLETLKIMSPGTPLREGLENILKAKTGAIIVIGDSQEVLNVVDGGFFINKEYWLDKYNEVKDVYIPMSKTFIYEESNDIKGFISIINNEFIGALFVDIDYQGSGIGKKLIDYVMDRYKKLVSNTFTFAVGTFSSKILVFLMLPLYTRVLSSAEYGKVDLIVQTCNILIPIASLGIVNAVIRFGLENTSNKKSIFSVGLITILLGFMSLFALQPILQNIKLTL